VISFDFNGTDTRVDVEPQRRPAGRPLMRAPCRPQADLTIPTPT